MSVIMPCKAEREQNNSTNPKKRTNAARKGTLPEFTAEMCQETDPSASESELGALDPRSR